MDETFWKWMSVIATPFMTCMGFNLFGDHPYRTWHLMDWIWYVLFIWLLLSWGCQELKIYLERRKVKAEVKDHVLDRGKKDLTGYVCSMPPSSAKNYDTWFNTTNKCTYYFYDNNWEESKSNEQN